MKVPGNRLNGVLTLLRGALPLAIFLCALPLLGQPQVAVPQATSASIAGKITTVSGENTTNNLSGITVKLTGPAPSSTSQTAITDSEGRYEFTHLAPGSYTVEGTVEGFKPWTATVTLGPRQAATADVSLQINSVEEHVEVHGEATEIATQSVSATSSADEQQIENLPLRTGRFTEAPLPRSGVIRTQEGS